MAENGKKILVVDNRDIIREALKALIEKHEQAWLVSTVDYGGLKVWVENHEPDVVLLSLLENGCTEVLKAVRWLQHPDDSLPILVLAQSENDRYLIHILKMGVMGCIISEASSSELMRSIRDVEQGSFYLSPVVSQQLLKKISRSGMDDADDGGEVKLSPQQEKVLKLMCRGFTNREIARIMVISKRTVEMHVYKLFKRLNVNNRTQAILVALREGLIEQEELDENMYQVLANESP